MPSSDPRFIAFLPIYSIISLIENSIILSTKLIILLLTSYVCNVGRVFERVCLEMNNVSSRK